MKLSNISPGALAVTVFITHLIFGVYVWYRSAQGKVELISGDSISYYTLAQNMLQHGTFSRQTEPPFTWEAYRTPGYPLVLAGCIALFSDYRMELVLQALLALCAAYALITLGSYLRLPENVIKVAILMLALLPNSLGLTAMVLTDAPSAHLFLISLALFVWAVEKEKIQYFLPSLLVLSVNQLIRPSLTYTGIAFVILYLILSNTTFGLRLIQAAGILLLTMVVPLYLSLKMAEHHGVFTVSMKGAETFRNYFVGADLSSQTNIPFSEIGKKIKHDDLEKAKLLDTGGTFERRLYQVQQEGIKQHLTAHPMSLVTRSINEFCRQLFAPQEYMLHALGIRNTALRAVGFILNLLLIAATVGGLIKFWPVNKRAVLGIIVVAASCMALNVISHKVGARLRLPVDLMFLLFAALGVVSFYNTINNRYRKNA